MATKDKGKTKKKLPLEQTLKELEAITSSIESDGLSLEDSLRSFEDGIKLLRQAQVSLQEAEQKVSLLIERDEDVETAPFPEDGEGG